MRRLTWARHAGWKRKLAASLVTLLRQGATPEKLALSIALGTMLGAFPIVGTTTLLCLAAGFALRLNHPALQLVNYILYPVYVPLILAFIRLGERLAGAPPLPFSPNQIAAELRLDPSAFLERFGLSGLHALLGWALVAPAAAVVVYFSCLPVLRKMARSPLPES